MKTAIILAVTILASAHAKTEQVGVAKITVAEVATLKTIDAAEQFIASHKLPSSKQTTDSMRRQGEQIPASAVGTVGRLSTTLFLDDSEAVAYVYFYHDKQGYIISTIVYIEPVNQP